MYIVLVSRQFDVRNTTRGMSEVNTCKEHLLYNEEERNVQNITIVFDPYQLFDPGKKIYGHTAPTPPTSFIWPTLFSRLKIDTF